MAEMAPRSSKAILVLQIVIPLVTFCAGMLTQFLIANRTLTQQEFATAANIATSEAAQKNTQLKQWADTVIAQYVSERRQSRPSEAYSPNLYQVSNIIVDDVCLFPKWAFLEPKGALVMDTYEANPDALIRQGARVVFLKAVGDFEILKRQYTLILDVLKDTCGFLKKR